MARATDRERLASYRDKRDFRRTSEPAGGTEPTGDTDAAGDTDTAGAAQPPPDAPRFVVQRHRARRLHYDLRLELDGVLVSWAVPKGPTLAAGVRRAAFRVEDHPLEYIDFEGVIPAGQYGGGDVIVWDAGTWLPADRSADASQALASGELHVDLYGEKLRGRFALVRTGDDGRQRWLLVHKRDAYAVDGWDPEEHPRSVRRGRTNEQVAAAPERTWRSDDATAPPPG